MNNSIIEDLLDKLRNVENFTFNFGFGLVFLSVLQGMGWINLSSSFMLGLSVTGFALAIKEVKEISNKIKEENRINKVFNFIINFMPILGILVIPNLKFVQNLNSDIIGYYSNSFTLIGLGFTLSAISQKSKSELIKSLQVYGTEISKVVREQAATIDELNSQAIELESTIDGLKENTKKLESRINDIELKKIK